MNCMKCGRETENENVFCQNCLQEMEKHPVHPGTVVLLHRRKEPSMLKKITKRHIPSPEEQLKLLRKQVIILWILLVIFAGAIALMFQPAMHYVLDEHVEIGQNYSSVTVTVPSSVED